MFETPAPTSTKPVVVPSSAERWWVVPAISLFTLAIFAASVIYVFVLRDKDYIMLMLGAVISLVNQGPWGFYFGTSKSSQQKDQTIAAKLNPPVISSEPGQPVPPASPPLGAG